MALKQYTTQELIELEDKLSGILTSLRTIRGMMKEANVDVVDSNLGTAILYVDWMDTWQHGEVASIRARMKAKKTREEKKTAKESKNK